MIKKADKNRTVTLNRREGQYSQLVSAIAALNKQMVGRGFRCPCI